MKIALEEVQDIINGNDENRDARIASFSEIKSAGYSCSATWKTYHVALIDSDKSYLLLVSPLAPVDSQPGITLPALSILLSKILDNTPVPVPRPVAHDVSGGGKWQFGWLLLRVPCSQPVSLASVRHELSPAQLARVELRLGTYLSALHGITNDWFGIPMDRPAPEPTVPSFANLLAVGGDEEEDMTPYSWQDTFVLLLEELLERVYGNAADIDIDGLRLSLTRAIGSFLFEDVEMPRLIWVTGNEEDVVVSLTEKGKETDIAYILPTFGRALWGDPLMEAWFMPPGPTEAMKEGYFGGEEDGTLIVFARQKTKRVWYTAYLALTVLAEGMSQGTSGGEVQWAKSILAESVETLKNAQYY